MAANINTNVLMNFIVKTVGSKHMNENQAQKLGIDIRDYDEANVDANDYLDIDEILDNSELYEQFATMFVDEKDKRETRDEEKDKEERAKVKDKNGTGV